MDRHYAFAEGLGAFLVRAGISRSVIDVNRNPTGASLYQRQAIAALTQILKACLAFAQPKA